jgi:hypothetical protein
MNPNVAMQIASAAIGRSVDGQWLVHRRWDGDQIAFGQKSTNLRHHTKLEHTSHWAIIKKQIETNFETDILF